MGEWAREDNRDRNKLAGEHLMSRDGLSSAVLDELNGRAINMILLAEFDFSDGLVNLWAGPLNHVIVFDGKTWTGLGDLGSIDKISESAGLADARTRVRLQVTSANLDQIDINAAANRGRAAKFILVPLDKDGVLVTTLESETFVVKFEMGEMEIQVTDRVDESGSRVVSEEIVLELLGLSHLAQRSYFRQQTHTDTIEIDGTDFFNQFASEPDLGSIDPLVDPRRPRDTFDPGDIGNPEAGRPSFG